MIYSSCNKYAYKTIYNQLDFILYLEVKKYFNPDDNQRQFVKQRLASLLKWNREKALPRYRNLFYYMKQSVQNGLSEENLIYLYKTLDSELKIIAEQAAPDAAEFALSLNKGQLDNFRQESYNHRKEDEEKRESEGRDSLERRTKSAVKLLSNVYGSFSDEQIEKIKEHIKTAKSDDYDRYEYQIIKQNEFIELVNNKAEKAEIALFLKNWVTRDSATTPASYSEKYYARRKLNIDLYLYVDNNIVTEKQRLNALNTFDKWIETINTLSSVN